MPDDPGADDDDLARFSAAPLGPTELRRMRRDMEILDKVRPMLAAYERGSTVGKAFIVVGAWIIGSGTALLGVLVGLKEIGWWPPSSQ